MTLIRSLFEGGNAGDAATNTNTGGTVSLGGGTQTLTTAAAVSGSLGLELVCTANSQFNVFGKAFNATANQVRSSFCFQYVGNGTSNALGATVSVAVLYLSGGSGNAIQYRVNSSNQMSPKDSTGSTNIGSALPVLTPGTFYRVETRADNTGGTAAGIATINLYTANGTSSLATWSSTTANLGSAAFGGMQFGNTISTATTFTTRYDNVQLDDGTASSEIGPYSATTPLSATSAFSPSSGASPLSGTLTITASGGTGSNRQYAVTNWGDGTNSAAQAGNTFTHTFTTSANQTYTITSTVTES